MVGKINLFDCCLINLLHRCFINTLVFNIACGKTIVNKGITVTNLLHRCFIDIKNLFDCCLIEKGKYEKNKLLKAVKQAILQEAIQGKLTEDWRDQNPNIEPANELLKQIKTEKEKLIKDPPAGRAGKKIRKEKLLPPIAQEDLPAGKAGIPFELPKGWVWCRLEE